MLVKVFPSVVTGSLQAPASKSCTQRALAAALLTDGDSVIRNAGKSNDELAALDIIQKLGAKVTVQNDNALLISSHSGIFKKGDTVKTLVVNCGESGLSMRMFAPITSLFDFDITLTGKGSLLIRPMDFLDEHLPPLGVRVSSNGGKVPITITGPLHPKPVKVDGSLSSQFLTGMLFAFCKAATEPVTIHVENLTSRPYIDLTLSVLKEFGFSVKNENYEVFHISPALHKSGEVIHYQVEGDWSNAAFLLVAAAVSGNILLKGMDIHSTQGDKKILEALKHSCADMEITEQGIRINKKEGMKSFQFDATHCPDLFPPLVALAANCEGVTEITGVDRLLHKESNRAVALRDEFGKMNVKVEVDGNLMRVHGSREISGANVSSHNDHRIAMAATVAALNADSVTTISNAQAVNKSYPGFFEDMKKLSVKLEKE